METVLVAGMYRADNPVIKYVTDHGIKAHHVPEDSAKRLPDTDFAIVITTNCGHGLMDKVKEAYKEKGILYSQGGISEIREKFEEMVVVPVSKTLEGQKLEIKVHYFLNMFFNIKERFDSKTFESRMHRYIKISQPAYSVHLKAAVDNGTISKIEGTRGLYVFNGITEEVISAKLKGLGVNLKVHIDHTKVENEYIPEVKEEPVQETAIKKDDVTLLYDSVEKMEKAMSEFQSSQTVKMMELTRVVHTLAQTVGPKNKDLIIQEINNKLQKMSMDKLIKFNTVFDVLMGD